jgi:HSP20 family protein
MRNLPRGDFWKSIHQKVNQTLGQDFWNEFSGILPFPYPRMDVFQQEENIVILMELPGLVNHEAIKLSLRGNKLLVYGEIPKLYHVDDEDVMISERYTGTFQRKIELPCAVDMERVKASYQNGILTVELVKIAEKEKYVEIHIDPQQSREENNG